MGKEDHKISDTFENLSASLAMLRKLEWRVRHAVESVLSGEYKSSFRGKGMEFDQVVKYEYGDDVRDIDWNVTARLGDPYVKRYVEEREVTLLLLFEDRPSLQFGSGERSKREALLELSSLLMLLSCEWGPSIANLRFSRRISIHEKRFRTWTRHAHGSHSTGQTTPQRPRIPRSPSPLEISSQSSAST